MIIITVVGETGFFPWLAVTGYRLSKGNVRVLFVILCVTCTLLSTFLGTYFPFIPYLLIEHSVSLMLLGPVTVSICNLLDLSPTPFLFGQVSFSSLLVV
jgi:Na+/H+ antiporter NhaD/arsenite permease-like protein